MILFLRKHFAQRMPTLSLSFLFPGWTSNWNDWLEKVCNQLPEHDDDQRDGEESAEEHGLWQPGTPWKSSMT